MSASDKPTAFTLAVVLASFVAGIPLRLWAILSVYSWNIRPVFGGPELRWQTALVAMVFLALLRAPQAEASDKDQKWSERAVAMFGKAVVAPLVGVGIGWWLR